MTALAYITRTARRPTGGGRWQCFWCWKQIVAGERYDEARYVDDGIITTVRAHRECAEAYNRSGLDEDEPITEPQPRGMTQSEEYDARRTT